ncbi:MAG: hypothetical protein Q9201_005542 [Fulgogasparrea decipioides]
MDFVTLGMFIIDEIHHAPPKAPDLDVMGGGGLYAALGARLFRPPPSSSRVGLVIHQGHDFPPNIRETIDLWDTDCQFVQTPNRATTRAYNRYEPNGHRAFRYLNEKVRIDENTLTSEQLASKTYHLICSPKRCINLVQGIKERRKYLAETYSTDDQAATRLTEDPVFVWEPMPDLCTPAELPKCLEALKYVDVISPNLDEFCSLFGISIDLEQPSGWSLLGQKCDDLLESRNGKFELAVVVRLGSKGCYVAQPGRHSHLPAYHEQDAAHHVIDPTGGGNSFLGGFCIGYLQSSQSRRAGRFEEAALYGTVAASFAIEQVGVPILTRSKSGEELWNGVNVPNRFEQYKRGVQHRATMLSNQDNGLSEE